MSLKESLQVAGFLVLGAMAAGSCNLDEHYDFEENNTSSEGYDCGDFCIDISDCCSRGAFPYFCFDDRDSCVSHCERELAETKNWQQEQGCNYPQEIIDTYFNILECLTQICDRGRCRWYEENFEERTGCNW